MPTHKTDEQTTSQGSPATGQAQPSFFSLNVRVGPIVTLLTFAACLPTWLGLGARVWWLLELVTHFTWHYAAILPVFLAVALWRRQKRLAAVVALSLAINLWHVAPSYLPAKVAPAADPPLRVMTLNVLTSNPRYDAVRELIAREQPHVLVLLEVNGAWIDALADLQTTYQHHLVRPRGDNFGIACYSNVAASQLRLEDFGDAEVPSVVAQFTWQGKPVTLVGTHPLPPTSASNATLRNNQLTAVADFARTQPGEAILVGDLNLTPYSPYFGDLLKQSGLVDSSRGRGTHATWSTRVEWLGLPIDHVLHSPELVVVDRRVGPAVGSDHRAVIVDFGIR